MNNWAIISSKTRVYQALALVHSIRENGDDSNIYLLATDEQAFEVLSFFVRDISNSCVYREEDVVSSDIIALKNSRKYFSYCWTLKPVFCDFLMKKTEQGSTVSYVDSDILFFGNVTNYLSERQYATFFTYEEHYFPNLDKNKVEHIKNIVGNFNSGFISFRNNADGQACLDWWRERCIESCDVNSQVFGDQKYLNEMPGLFSGVLYEESINLNVGPWNILKRKVSVENGRVKFGGLNLLFYHYVGFRLKNKNSTSIMENIPTAINSFFDVNPSGRIIYDIYIDVLSYTISKISEQYHDFNGYTEQDAEDWANYQVENDVLGLN